MGIELNLNSVSTAVASSLTTDTKAADSTETKDTSTTAASGFSEDAAVYEKSGDTTATDGGVYTKSSVNRDAIIAQMKADAQARQDSMMNMVREMMGQQGKAIGEADDVWKFLASGDFTIDEAAKAKAEEAISEDGEFGVEKTSDRIVEFAKALAGDDASKADELLDAFKKGFDEATKTWGKELPDISQKTYDAVVKKFDDWKNSANSTDQATQAAAANYTTDAASVEA